MFLFPDPGFGGGGGGMSQVKGWAQSMNMNNWGGDPKGLVGKCFLFPNDRCKTLFKRNQKMQRNSRILQLLRSAKSCSKSFRAFSVAPNGQNQPTNIFFARFKCTFLPTTRLLNPFVKILNARKLKKSRRKERNGRVIVVSVWAPPPHC